MADPNRRYYLALASKKKRMSSSVTVKELSRRLYACTDADGKVKNVNAVLEIMKSLETTKITVNDLQETRLGRHVNLIRKKTSDSMLMKRSRKLIKLWQKVAETKPAASTSSTTAASTSSDDATSSRLAATPLRKQMLMTPGGTPAASSSTPRPRNNLQQTPKISKKQALSHQHQQQTPLNHRLNGHSSTASTKRKNNATDVATPSAKRARTTASNVTPAPSTSNKRSGVGSSSWRKSHTTSSLPEDDGEKFASSLQGTKLLISIKKQKPTTSTLPTPTTKTTKNNHNQQKQSQQQQHSRKQLVYDNSPQSLDSLDSDRTMDNTSPPVDVTKSKEPSVRGGPPAVYFDVKTDPYFCSSLTPTPQQLGELKEDERHGENGCLGDNGRFYRWEEDCIVMKHRYLPTRDDPNDEGLLLIMPYVELE